jgi:hypothetical protein
MSFVMGVGFAPTVVGDIFNRGGVTFAPAICFSEFSVVKKISITILTYLLPADAIYIQSA